MNKFVRKLSVGALAVVLVAGAFSSTASAATDTLDATTTVEGGSLSIGKVGITSFSNIRLDGSTQELTTTVNPFSVIDATGTGSGWNLNVTASQLTSTIHGGTLPHGSLNVSGTSVAAQEGASAASTITTVGGNIDTTTGGVKLLTASAGGGMGTFDITGSTLALKLQPKDTKTGTYSSTITFSLVTGP